MSWWNEFCLLEVEALHASLESNALSYVFELIKSLDKHVLRVYYVPGILLANGDLVLIKKLNIPAFMELTFWKVKIIIKDMNMSKY